MDEQNPQYALILDGRLIAYTTAENVIEAGEWFMKNTVWPKDAICTNLTELLRGL